MSAKKLTKMLQITNMLFLRKMVTHRLGLFNTEWSIYLTYVNIEHFLSNLIHIRRLIVTFEWYHNFYISELSHCAMASSLYGYSIVYLYLMFLQMLLKILPNNNYQMLMYVARTFLRSISKNFRKYFLKKFLKISRIFSEIFEKYCKTSWKLFMKISRNISKKLKRIIKFWGTIWWYITKIK